MTAHIEVNNWELRKQLRQQTICFAGNRQLKIYGDLHCSSGKRMKRENRVFFASGKEATEKGYRPCGHCMRSAYQIWKNGPVQ